MTDQTQTPYIIEDFVDPNNPPETGPIQQSEDEAEAYNRETDRLAEEDRERWDIEKARRLAAGEYDKKEPIKGVDAMIAVIGKIEPYNATEQAAKVYTVEFFNSAPRSFTAGDYKHHFSNVSYRGEGRAAIALDGMKGRIDEVRNLAFDLIARAPDNAELVRAAFDAHARKHIEFNLAYIGNYSRLASAMITGPSNFPQARQRKLSDQHHNKLLRLIEHVKIGKKRLRRAAFPHGDPKNGIRSNNPAAVQLLELKIKKLEENQDYYKQANKDVRAAMKTADPIAAMTGKGYSPQQAREYTAYEYEGEKNRAFGGYVTTNNLANIKRLKSRLAILKKAKASETENKQYELENGETFELVRNSDAMRIQLLFSGKPSNLTRAALKSKGFRWAPSQSAWQRHLNSNGEYALERLLKELEAKECEAA